MKRPSRHGLAGALALSLGSVSGWAAAGDEPPVRMEPVFVEAASSNPWQYFRVPGFEVISHCPDDFNRVYARALEASTAARAALLPRDFWGGLSTPMKIVLYNREPEGGQAFSRPKPIDLSWVSGDDGTAGPYSLLRTYPTVVGDGDTFISCGNYWSLLSSTSDFYADPDSEIRVRCRLPQLPHWFVSGLVGPGGILATWTVEPGAGGQEFAVVPSVTWGSRAETLALIKDPKRPRAVMALSRFFGAAVPAGEEDAWDAEAALLVRWGLFGTEPDGRPHREAFLDLVRGACGQPVTETRFRELLGMGFAEAEARLRAYVAVAVREPVRLPLGVAREKTVEIREATPTEVARIVGDWGRLEARAVGMQNLDYQRECLDQADRLFERIYARQTSDPGFLAAFGLYALQVGDVTRGREALESATGAGVVRARAYLELARLKLGDSLPFAEQGIGDLNEADYGRVVGLLDTAMEQAPSLVGSYLLLAKAMEHAPKKPALGDMEVLEGAVALFPGNASLAYKVATLYKRFGYPEKAQAVIARAFRMADTNEDRARLAAFVVRDR